MARGSVGRRPKPKYKIAVTQISPATTAGSQVECPASRHVIGGGIQLEDVAVSVAHPVTVIPADLGADGDSLPDDRMLEVAGVEGTAGGSATMDMFAVCL